MQINGIASKLVDLVGSTVHQSKSPPSSPVDEQKSAASRFEEIAGRYDLHQITPQEFSSMIAELHDAGAIDDGDRSQLAGIRQALDDDLASPDEPVDLFAFVADRLRGQELQLRQLGADAPAAAQRELQSQLDDTRQQIQWLDRLAQAGGKFDAVA